MSTSNSDLLPTPKKDGGAATAADRPLLSAPGAYRIQRSEPSQVTEKRGEPRYKCEGSAEFRTDGFEVRTWARVTDLSRSGCYVEMQATSPLNTAVTLMIEVNGLRLHLKGDVKTSYRMQGMGIEFTEIPDADRAAAGRNHPPAGQRRVRDAGTNALGQPGSIDDCGPECSVACNRQLLPESSHADSRRVQRTGGRKPESQRNKQSLISSCPWRTPPPKNHLPGVNFL